MIKDPTSILPHSSPWWEVLIWVKNFLCGLTSLGETKRLKASVPSKGGTLGEHPTFGAPGSLFFELLLFFLSKGTWAIWNMGPDYHSIGKEIFLLILFASLLLIFCLVVLSIIECRVLKFPTVMVKLSILSVLSFFLHVFWDSLYAKTGLYYICLMDCSPYHYKMSSFAPSNSFI